MGKRSIGETQKREVDKGTVKEKSLLGRCKKCEADDKEMIRKVEAQGIVFRAGSKRTWSKRSKKTSEKCKADKEKSREKGSIREMQKMRSQ